MDIILTKTIKKSILTLIPNIHSVNHKELNKSTDSSHIRLPFLRIATLSNNTKPLTQATLFNPLIYSFLYNSKKDTMKNK